ncbi:protein kinase domain-containing protein [Deinococcus sp. Marseille-Q6407]|uniref:protein kinase domain-containing protein n=1 Tax=Deinococcus sp. Marseille-Q6407 TaxID=2969223 RepID=UPI0039658A09
MEYVPGGQTLEERIVCGRRPTLAWRIQTLQNILGAVQLAHSEGVIHRDLSLSNILFDADENTIKLSDFGTQWVTTSLPAPPGGQKGWVNRSRIAMNCLGFHRKASTRY